MTGKTTVIKPFRVLTLDGGGMRGLYTATLLKHITNLFDNKYQGSKDVFPDIGKSFDLICGTSTGAILSCALAYGIPIDDIISLYSSKGSEIFPHPSPKTPLKLSFWITKFLKKNPGKVNVLKKELEKCFSSVTIGELYSTRKISICIPSINAETHKAWVFKTPHNPEKHRDDNYTLVDICMASAAAPIIFPLHKCKHPELEMQNQFFVDGGLWANNPIMIGLLEALGCAKEEQSIEIISVGTCELPSGDPSKIKTKMGILDWKAGINIADMAISAQAFGYHNMAMFLSTCLNKLGKKVTIYRMIESLKSPQKYSAIGLDVADKTAIQTLIGMATTDAEKNHSQILGDLDDHKHSMTKNIFSNFEKINKE